MNELFRAWVGAQVTYVSIEMPSGHWYRWVLPRPIARRLILQALAKGASAVGLRCLACSNHYQDSGQCDLGRPVASPHRRAS